VPLRRALVLVVLVVVLAGCRVDVSVHVVLRDDGTGTASAEVTLDAEAVQRTEADGRTLAGAIRLDGFADAGWEVSAWQRGDDGSASLELAHEFANEAELRRRLSELDGGAVFGDVKVVRERGLFRSRDEVSVDVDMREVGARLLDDEELVASLQAAGLDVATLDQQLEAELRDSLRVNVTMEAPDETVTAAELAPGQRQSVAAAGSDFNGDRAVAVVIAGILLFLGLLLYLAASASSRRTRAREADGETVDRTPLM